MSCWLRVRGALSQTRPDAYSLLPKLASADCTPAVWLSERKLPCAQPTPGTRTGAP